MKQLTYVFLERFWPLVVKTLLEIILKNLHTDNAKHILNSNYNIEIL